MKIELHNLNLTEFDLRKYCKDSNIELGDIEELNLDNNKISLV
jgi:hypothetical protein